MYITWPDGMLVGPSYSAGSLGGRTSLERAQPLDLPCTDMLAVKHRRKKDPKTQKSSPLHGHTLLALWCPLSTKFSIAPADKGEGCTHSDSSTIQREGRRERGGGFGTERQ